MYLCGAKRRERRQTCAKTRMRIIKKLDIYIIRNFLLLFAGTFFVCLFIFVMQFLWMWMNNLIGKGLTIDILAEFFWYSSLTLIPRSVPLAVLLASLISFGNLGEHLELLSMKSAGIPLIRILAPLIFVAVLICGASFVFQDKVSPYATRELSRLAWSMKQKSPELALDANDGAVAAARDGGHGERRCLWELYPSVYIWRNKTCMVL